jgi:hypothetical protein
MSPFKSKAQMKYMFKNLPKLAKQWEDKYGVPKKLPLHVKPKKVKQTKRRKKK